MLCIAREKHVAHVKHGKNMLRMSGTGKTCCACQAREKHAAHARHGKNVLRMSSAKRKKKKTDMSDLPVESADKLKPYTWQAWENLCHMPSVGNVLPLESTGKT